jgi:hypothetical protein
MRLPELLHDLEADSPEILAAIETFPPDVQAVVADFKKDYRAALANFKESWVSAFSWASQAKNELEMLKSYLEAEQLRQSFELPTRAAESPKENK